MSDDLRDRILLALIHSTPSEYLPPPNDMSTQVDAVIEALPDYLWRCPKCGKGYWADHGPICNVTPPPWAAEKEGRPVSDEVSELTIAALHAIGTEIERIMQNHLQEEWTSPMGGGESFHTEAFTARPYCWCDNDDEICPPNFVWRHIEIRWYKHANRCVTSNHWIDPVTVSDMLEDCLDSLRDMEKTWRDER